MENTSRAVRALLPNGIEVRVEASQSPGSHDRDVVESADKVFELHAVQGAIEGISQLVMNAFEKAKPKKVNVEFGLEISLESGKLTALWVKGSGKANLKIDLEWAT